MPGISRPRLARMAWQRRLAASDMALRSALLRSPPDAPLSEPADSDAEAVSESARLTLDVSVSIRLMPRVAVARR